MKGQGCRGRYTPPPFLSRRASRHMLIPSQESVICSVASSYLHTRVVLFPNWENTWGTCKWSGLVLAEEEASTR